MPPLDLKVEAGNEDDSSQADDSAKDIKEHTLAVDFLRGLFLLIFVNVILCLSSKVLENVLTLLES